MDLTSDYWICDMESNATAKWHPSPSSVLNVRTGVQYQLVTADCVTPSDAQLENIAQICNEQAIYDFLFRERLGGRSYTKENASEFLSWATAGWREQSHFVFLLLAPSALVVGALDIKSPDRATAEIGYWCSHFHRGLMSNAVAVLVRIAGDAGFHALWARVRNDNEASRKVLQRNGFIHQGAWENDSSRSWYLLSSGAKRSERE